MEWVCHSSALCLWIWSNRNCPKPNALLYGRVTLVRSSDQDFLVIGMSLWEEMCSLHFPEGFSASLASCASAGGQEVCQQGCTTCILKVGFSQLVMAGSSPCLRQGQAVPVPYFPYGDNSSLWSCRHIWVLGGAVNTVWLSLLQMHVAKLN